MNPVRVVSQLLLGTPFLVATMLLGCALPPGSGAPPTIPISVSSNNGSDAGFYSQPCTKPYDQRATPKPQSRLCVTLQGPRIR